MNLQLLIVDDDVNLTRHLKAFFERQKYKVELAHDGLEAVEMAEKVHPHLMFLDIGLPGLSGIEVLRRVKNKDPGLRVIMITGQTEDDLVRQARFLGADDYITKPFTLEYLSGEVMDKLHKQLFYELRATSDYLAIEREKVELLFAQVSEGMMMFDLLGILFIANPVARGLLGIAEDHKGLSIKEVFHSFQAKPPDRLERLEQCDGQPFDLVREMPKKLVLECRLNPIIGPKNEKYGHLMLLRDVTQERKAESAMHRFISMISHKLRTPLVTIRAYPRLLLSDNSLNPLNDFQKNALRVIVKQCQLLEDMVNQLIAFSNLEADDLLLQPTALQDLIAEAEKVLPDEMKDKVGAVKCESELSRLRVQVDPTLVQHAFRNIIENAFKFGAKELRVAGRADNGSVIVQFSDDGPGIPPEDRERIFERFYQVEKDFCGQIPGAGLGLTMVKQTVEAHGGKVWVESDVGKGSTFFVRLPVAQTS
jgi:signal transduction histidine kinase